jgi:polysaccharide chain length determinant protein (PEP-CTERM system associated)
MQALTMLLRRYATGVWRHRWLALAVAWSVCVLGWTGVAFVPNQYEASTRLYVDADAVLTPLLRGLAVDSATVTELEVLQNTLLSRPNLEKVIAGTDLDLRVATPFDREWLRKRLASEIKITPQTRNLFTISYASREPKLAYDVVQKLITIFIDSATGSNRSEMDNAGQFLEQQIASYEAKLREAERRRADFRAKYVDVLPGENAGVSRLEQAGSQVAALKGELADATAKRELLISQLKGTAPLLVTESGGAGGEAPGTSLAAAERHLQELRLRYTEEFPDVIAARRLVAMLKAHPEAAAPAPGGGGGGHTRSMPNAVYEQLKVRLVDTEATIASLKRRLAGAVADRDRLEAVARTEPTLQAEYVNLDRDYSVLKQNYDELLARRESMHIAEAADKKADKVRLRIVDPPQVPRVPAGPNRLLLVSAVLVAGIGAGGGLAVLLMQLDQTFYTTRDLRALGLPVLGGISLFRPRVRWRSTPALLGFSAGVLLLFALYGGWLLHPLWITRLV